jgi:tetratricopeptide (TPR) repeat protein
MRMLARGRAGVESTLAVALLVWASAAGAQEEIFERANQLYQAGDYEAAVEAYEAVLSGGFESADLHYNLGNAHFKLGRLGWSILSWERALALEPGDPDAQANLDLARSLIADDIEPLPRFWLLSVAWWWVDLLPRVWLVFLVGAAWLALTAGLMARILARAAGPRTAGLWLAVAGLIVVLVLGTNLVVRELGLGTPERAVIMVEMVPVRSAPAADDDLTVFEVHEGTRVRVDQRTEEWAEIVLDDGKVGWIPVHVMEVI